MGGQASHLMKALAAASAGVVVVVVVVRQQKRLLQSLRKFTPSVRGWRGRQNMGR